MTRRCYLTTAELHRLDLMVAPLLKLDDHSVYLVGSAGEKPDYRDVDVRMILGDADFDRMFGHSPDLWGVFCYAVSRWLTTDTGLPIDFQVQRQTEANEKHSKWRNPLRGGRRDFAGLGDATKFETSPAADDVSAPTHQSVCIDRGRCDLNYQHEGDHWDAMAGQAWPNLSDPATEREQ